MKRLNSLIVVAVCMVLVEAMFAEKAIAQADHEKNLSTWRSQTLSQLSESLQNVGLADPARNEIQARHRWLEKWNPGQLGESPTSQDQINPVPEKRVEPVLRSRVATRVEMELSKKEGLSENEQHEYLQEQATLNSNDPAVQQAYLRWMDDGSDRRKRYLAEIDIVTRRLAHHLEKLLERQSETRAGVTAKKESAITKLAYEFVVYRHVRGLAYRELPDVVEGYPIEDQGKLDHEINEAFQKLQELTGGGRTEFVLIEIRVHRRNGNYGTALQLLERFGHSIAPKWYLKKRRDILEQLDWAGPCSEAASIYGKHFPEQVALETQRKEKRRKK